MQTYAAGTLANVCWTPQTQPSTVVRPHVHTFYELVFVEAGEGSHIINGSTVPARAGHLALLAPGSSHDPRGLPGRAAFWVFIFNAHALSSEGWAGAIYTGHLPLLGAAQLLLRHLYASRDHCLQLEIARADRPELVKHLRVIEKENQGSHIGAEQLIASHLNILLVDLLRRTPDAAWSAARSSHPVVSQAMTYIDRNFSDAITLADIARHVGRSPAHLTHFIRLHTGMSAVAWLSDRRLWEAKNLILTSRMSVAQIATSLGYRSIRHFSSMFKRHYGESPARWRRRLIS
jgi:AraC-like DNA-binding protein